MIADISIPDQATCRSPHLYIKTPAVTANQLEQSKKPILRIALLCLLSLLLLDLSGCSSVKKKKSGGYYQNDGPGSVSEMRPEHFQDAVPKVEPLMSGPNKPYTVKGKQYVPDTREVPYKKRGGASWYGKQFHGRKTSSGEVYDMYAMTAAHTTLPIPSYAKVTNLSNGRSIIVRVNDRGPFHSSRIIDLSYGGAYRLGFINQGTAQVEVERILPADIRAGRVPDTTEKSPTSNSPSQANLSSGFYVQVGVYSDPVNAQKMRDQLEADGQLNSYSKVVVKNALYRLYLGPYRTEAEAQKMMQRAERISEAKALVVDLR